MDVRTVLAEMREGEQLVLAVRNGMVSISAIPTGPEFPGCAMAISAESVNATERDILADRIREALDAIRQPAPCHNDTDGDGDCHLCAPGPCRGRTADEAKGGFRARAFGL